MKARLVDLPMAGFGTHSTQAQVEVTTLSTGERLRRAAIAPAIGLCISLLVLPIPIVHFAVPPVALVTGIVLGVRRALQDEIITRANGPCPFCGTDQTLGLSGTVFRLPRALKCRSCLKLFTISADSREP